MANRYIRQISIALFAVIIAFPFTSRAQNFVKPGQVWPGNLGSLSLTLTAGGVAQTLMAEQTREMMLTCMFRNPTTAIDQGISAALGALPEAVYIRWDGVAATATSGGPSFMIGPGETLITGPQVKSISWIAATTGHKLQGACWQ